MTSSTMTIATIDRAVPVRRRATILAVLMMALMLATPILGGAPTAHADIYAGGGNVGAYVINAPISCKWKIFGRTSNLVMDAPSPQVFAFNARAGANNDQAWVRYRLFLVDASTGAAVQTTSYSEWRSASDVSPAVWGTTTLAASAVGGNYRIDYRIEWWNSTTQTAWIADRVTKYRFLNQYNAGPAGPLGSCMIVNW